MGLTAAYALVPAVESPLGDAVGVRCEGAASGWAAYALDGDGPFDLAPRLATHSGPLVTAMVHDSDFCVIAGRVAGAEIFRWIVNEELYAAYGLGGRREEPDESTQAVERAAAVEAIRDWTHRSGLPDIDAERVNDVLARGYVLAEEGLWALLAELGALPPGGHLHPTTPPDPRSEWAAERPPPPPVAVVLSDGDASVLPTRPRRIMLAAALTHDGSAWDRFVRRHELEEWGRPACLVADSGDVVPQGSLETWERWQIALGSDPAIGLFTWSGPLGTWFEGPWVMIPDEATADETTAIVWARENVGRCASPPTAHRQQLATECDPDDRRYGSGHIRARVADARLGFALFTYHDLMDDVRGLLDSLTEVHDALITPIAAQFRDRLVHDLAEEVPYGAKLSLTVTSTKQRLSIAVLDDTRWLRALRRLERGELRELSIRLSPLNGEGHDSQYRSSLNVSITLRDQFTEPTGPLPDDHPAIITVTAPRTLLDQAVADGVTYLTGLMRTAAIRFHAVHGYASASGYPGQHTSQYERRHNLGWDHGRLDTTTRGVHWGNLIGDHHLAAIGGHQRLQQLRDQGILTAVEQWATQPNLWWFQVSDDPYGRNNQRADEAATHLRQIMPKSE